MRLWHESLISYLPRQQLLGQHRECCALRGNGWGKPHSVVNYVFDHPYEWLWVYHMKVMREMTNRGFHVDPDWLIMGYQGRSKPKRIYYAPKQAPKVETPGMYPAPDMYTLLYKLRADVMVYPEHNDAYLQECKANLLSKGIDLTEVI